MTDQEKLVTKIREALDKSQEGRYTTLAQDDHTEGFILGLEYALGLVTETALESAPACEYEDR